VFAAGVSEATVKAAQKAAHDAIETVNNFQKVIVNLTAMAQQV